jgi:hypothetical protein
MFKMDSGVLLQDKLRKYSFDDVPNSYTSELKLGYAASKFYGDAYVANQTSTSGVDILGVFKDFPSYKSKLY